MPVSLPYLASNKNVGLLFQKIASAKIPSKFTHDFLVTTVGLKGNNDRPLITLLKNLGFLDQSGTPTASYALLKGEDQGAAIAAGIKDAYAPLFASNEKANELSGDKLKSLVAQIAGSDDTMSARIASTFAALTKVADFKKEMVSGKVEKREKAVERPNEEDTENSLNGQKTGRVAGLRTEFHYNIQVHLPANGTEDTYLNIFNAIRKTFQ
jgi:hypothetical protein